MLFLKSKYTIEATFNLIEKGVVIIIQKIANKWTLQRKEYTIKKLIPVYPSCSKDEAKTRDKKKRPEQYETIILMRSLAGIIAFSSLYRAELLASLFNEDRNPPAKQNHFIS